MEKNKIIYDYVTFTTKIHDLQGVIDLLGLSDVTFLDMDRGFNGYPHGIQFGSIKIGFGAREEMGICVDMSGQGCRTFETYGNGDFDGLFDTILENYSDDSEKRQMNLTRLDIAYDDFTGYLDIDTIAVETLKQNYVSRSSKWSVTNSSEGCSVGIGSMRSDIYIRIYDKKAERNRDDLDHWVRCEIQLRGVNAVGFAKLGGDVCKNYFGVINNYLRFVTPSSNDTNKRRWKSADWWIKFLESYDSVSIFARPGVEYNIMKLDRYVFKQCAGAVKTMIDIIGIKKFFKQLSDSLKGSDLNPKYKDLKNQMGTSADSILDYLRERGEAV